MAKTAWLNWSDTGQEWVLRTFEDGWRYVDSWKVESRGEDEDGTSLDMVPDSILCNLAYLQEEGYTTKVTVNGNYTQKKGDDD